MFGYFYGSSSSKLRTLGGYILINRYNTKIGSYLSSNELYSLNIVQSFLIVHSLHENNKLQSLILSLILKQHVSLLGRIWNVSIFTFFILKQNDGFKS